MNVIGAIISLWQSANGHKFNSGAAITLLAIVFQQVFAQLGVSHDQAVNLATYIIEGVGAVIMVIGYSHKLIKGNK